MESLDRMEEWAAILLLELFDADSVFEDLRSS